MKAKRTLHDCAAVAGVSFRLLAVDSFCLERRFPELKWLSLRQASSLSKSHPASIGNNRQQFEWFLRGLGARLEHKQTV